MLKTNALSIGHNNAASQSTVVQAAWIFTFALLTAVGAQVEIPHQPVPYTLQSMFVLLSGALLGTRNGGLSQIAYLALGAIGLPVFSGFGFGLVRLLGPTGGYLLSFPIAAMAVGYIINRQTSVLRIVISMIVGLFIVFSLGTVQLYVVYYRDWSAAILNGFLIFSMWDIVKLSAAAAIYHQYARWRYASK